MLFRILIFLAVLLAGAVAGVALGGQWGPALGVIAAASTWFIADLLRGLRVEGWLRLIDAGVDAGRFPAMGGLWGEIAERVRRALRASDLRTVGAQSRLEEFLAAIQASPNGVTLLDAEGRIEWCNQTSADHLGFDAQRDAMQRVVNLVRDPGFVAYVQGGDHARDVVIPGRGSTPMSPRKVSVQLHAYGEGRRLLLSRDVTALEQAETMRRDFVANVSHEIRTPLTVLTGFVETLQNLPLDEAERVRYLGLMSAQAHRMQALVSDLLVLSRLEGSPPPPVQEWTPARALLAGCEQEARGLGAALGKSQDLRFEADADLSVAVETLEWAGAMSNLVANAIRYTPNGGSIDVRWRVVYGGRSEFSVRDTGEGVAPEHVPRLTERFYRVDRSRSRETGGTGLGLAIVKHVAQRHGGELRIDSVVGVGSTFTLCLPASRVRAEVSAPVVDASTPTPAA
jgi:two-component system phosphate regulon sensor histidine kinase PhoR